MSFDLTIWVPDGTVVDPAGVRAWLAADDRVADPQGAPLQFSVVTTVAGQPWAAIEFDDVSDLEDEDLAERFVPGPDGFRPAGLRLEISYSAPDDAAGEIIRLFGDLAERIGGGVIDEQADTTVAAQPAELGANWSATSTQARELFERMRDGRA